MLSQRLEAVAALVPAGTGAFADIGCGNKGKAAGRWDIPSVYSQRAW